MTAHPTVETLSTYLDRELKENQKRRLEGHLSDCAACRQRLQGLHKVTRDLRALERLTPPAHLGPELHRIAALEGREPSLLERLEQSATRLTSHATLLPLFAVVMALVLIIYLFSLGLARRDSGRIPVHLEAPTAEAVPATTAPAVGDRQQLAGRDLVFDGRVWIEHGLENETEIERVRIDEPLAEQLLRDSAELRLMVEAGQPVRIAIDDRVVQIDRGDD